MIDYPAFITNVHDGDTVTARFQVRLSASRTLSLIAEMTETIRLYGINTPELNTAEGRTARAWLLSEIQSATMLVTLRCDLARRDKYGRLLGILLIDGKNLNDALVAGGMARPYFGHGLKLDAS